MGNESQYEEASDRNSGGRRGRGAGMVAAAALLLLLGGGVGFGLGSGVIPGTGTESAAVADKGDSTRETAEEASEKTAVSPEEEAEEEPGVPEAAAEETEPAAEAEEEPEETAEPEEEDSGSGDAGGENPAGESSSYAAADEELTAEPGENGTEEEPEEAEEEPEVIPDVIVVRISGNEVTVNGHPAENPEDLKSKVGEYADGVRTFELEENRAILETYNWVVEAFDEMEIFLKEAD